ncbi:hypothetical protein CW304_29825 [Bacillus sp. UFRGS-B20]|nr:hypothetical protein CW304_29825 [Bacillus sp. UFRGS-B20]
MGIQYYFRKEISHQDCGMILVWDFSSNCSFISYIKNLSYDDHYPRSNPRFCASYNQNYLF